jgi:hypothetical protein
MLTNFRVGDRVEDKETHKRGRVTFLIAVLAVSQRRQRLPKQDRARLSPCQ